MEDDEPLFTEKLVSTAIASSLSSGYTIRPLRRSDFHRGVLAVLEVLTVVGHVNEAKWNERYDYYKRRQGDYYVMVILNGQNQVVAVGSLFIEYKM